MRKPLSRRVKPLFPQKRLGERFRFGRSYCSSKSGIRLLEIWGRRDSTVSQAKVDDIPDCKAQRFGECRHRQCHQLERAVLLNNHDFARAINHVRNQCPRILSVLLRWFVLNTLIVVEDPNWGLCGPRKPTVHRSSKYGCVAWVSTKKCTSSCGTASSPVILSRYNPQYPIAKTTAAPEVV